MVPRIRRYALGAACAGAVVLAGCSGQGRQALRPRAEPIPELSDRPRDETEDAAAEAARGFFKPTRGAGTWSSEAREIEGHLGVTK